MTLIKKKIVKNLTFWTRVHKKNCVLYIESVKSERMGVKFYKSFFLVLYFLISSIALPANSFTGDPVAKTNKLTLDIFPNPAATVTNIKIKGSENAQILILNSLGKLIKEIKMTNVLTSLPVDDLNAGLYIIKIKDQNSDAVISKRLLVEK